MRRVFVIVSLVSISTILMAVAMPGLAARQGATSTSATATANASGVDTIVDLVKGGMPESLVLKTIQKDGKAYNLGPADLLKLQKAGVSEKIIEAMLDPSSATPGSPAPAPAGAAAAVASTPAPAASASAKSNGKADKTADKSTDKKSGGMFSSLKDKLKDSAQKTVDGVGNTTESAVDKSVNTGQAKLDDAIPSVDDKKPATTAAKTTATTTKK